MLGDATSFAASARHLARNPLGIIALFIVLIYAFASLVVGFSNKLTAAERLPVIWLYHPWGVQGMNRRVLGVRMDVRGELPTVAAWRVQP